MKPWAKQTGLTIVELLIVIVVIGILAAISIVAYNGVQQRARDGQRLQDMASIVKALELYKAQFGAYPAAVGNSPGGWEISSNPNANHPFLQQLVTANIVSQVPVDPVNTGDMNTAGSKIYAYYRYPAGTGGCPTAYYVLAARTGESSTTSATSPGGTCSSAGGPGGWWQKLSQDN